MKGKLLTLLGFLYVSYAIATAHQALARFEAADPVNVIAGEVHKRQFQGTPSNRRPMDFVDEETYVGIRGEYRVVLWEKNNCHWCTKFKRNELPTLREADVKVEIKTYGKDKPEEGQKPVRLFPTIRVYRGNILVKEFVGYTDADEILKVVKYRTVLLK